MEGINMAAGHVSENHPLGFGRVNIFRKQSILGHLSRYYAWILSAMEQKLTTFPSRCVPSESRAMRVFRPLVCFAEVRD